MLEPKFAEHPNRFQQVLEEKLEVALPHLQPAEGCVPVPVQPKAAAVHSQPFGRCNVWLTLDRQVGLDYFCSLITCSKQQTTKGCKSSCITHV